MTNNINLQAMKIFVAVFESRNVGLAARRVGMSQSGVSTVLAKLRAMLKDALFESVGGSMLPTSRAKELVGPMRAAIACIDEQILGARAFHPETDDREFRVALSDVAEAIYIPRALNALSHRAPHLRLRSVELPQVALQQALSEGDVDLALGYFPDLQSSEFMRRKIGQHSFVCICSSANRSVIEGFNLQKYSAARHVVVEAPGRSQGIFERYLQQRGIVRAVGLTTPHFMSLPEIISGTNMLASIPKALADFFSEMKRLVQLELPFSSPVFETHLHWSKSVHKDQGNQWLRSVLAQEFRAVPR